MSSRGLSAALIDPSVNREGANGAYARTRMGSTSAYCGGADLGIEPHPGGLHPAQVLGLPGRLGLTIGPGKKDRARG